MRDSVSDVLKAIAVHGPVSRAQLARDLDLSGPTLSLATKQLLQRGLIMEVEQTRSTGGRPATLLGLVPAAGMILGVKLAADHLVGVCSDLESQILWTFEEPFSSRGNDAVLELGRVLSRYVTRVEGELLGIGIGIPGVVASDDSVTADSAMLDWSSLNVGDELAGLLGAPVILENDVNTLAISESLFGRGKDFENFLTITLGRGVGLGIVLNGALYNGTRGAGEFGHVSTDQSQIQCECGKAGCLETLVAEPYLAQSAITQKFVSPDASISDVYEVSRKDAEIAEKLFSDPGKALGRAIANLINVFGPELVLISGEGSEAWDLWEKYTMPEVLKNAVPTLSHFDVEIDPWDDKKWAMGAASLVLQASLNRSSIRVPALRAVKNRLQVLPGELAG